jgi:hypothetical protein
MPRQPPLDERFTDHAAIALATVAIEHALETAAPPPDVHAQVAALVADLWAWQTNDKLAGHQRMSEDEARALPSFAYYGQIAGFSALRDRHAGDLRVHALLSAVCSLLEFVVWIMEGVERALNWDKPRVIGKEIGEEAWGPLHDGLESLTLAARSPKDEFAWQERIVAAFAAAYPGGGSEDGEADAGSSVSRDDAHRL